MIPCKKRGSQATDFRPWDLPWAIYIEPQNRPAQFADASSCHPTFLFEALWDVLVCRVLLWVACRFSGRLKAGDVSLLYVSFYSVGRFLVETLHVDQTFLIGDSVRGNLLGSGVPALGFALLLRHSCSSQGTKTYH